MKTENTDRIIEFGHPNYMSMFTDAGNLAVVGMCNKIALDASSGLLSRKYLSTRIERDSKTLESNGYGEVFDTVVRAAIRDKINREVCAPKKWLLLDYWLEDNSEDLEIIRVRG